jgi:hypothetical protein
MRTLPGKYDIDFDCRFGFSTQDVNLVSTMEFDTAGFTYKWLMKYSPKIRWFDQGSLVRTKNEKLLKVVATWRKEVTELYPDLKVEDLELYSEAILHIRNGCNWKKFNASYADASNQVFKVLSSYIIEELRK